VIKKKDPIFFLCRKPNQSVLLRSLLFLTASSPTSEAEGVIRQLVVGQLLFPSKVFLRLELPLGATPFKSFLESLAVKLTKIAAAVAEPEPEPEAGVEAELAGKFLLAGGLVGVEFGMDLFLNCLSFPFFSELGY
jgi:hypothetical protein